MTKNLFSISAKRIKSAKRAFSTRRIKPREVRTLLTGDLRPEPGDLVLARVDELGKQTRLELTDGRRAHLFPGDEIIVCYGNRYAPDQFEAEVGPDLSPCDLVAAGGVASVELSRHDKMRPPTQITPLGLLGDAAGNRLNLMQYRIDATDAVPTIPAILSLGTSMNSGKTLTATSLVKGFKRLGIKVAALKITGTGSGNDMWIVRDAGADVSLDFTDAGYASTYLVSIPDIETATRRLMNYAASQGCEVAVIEIADGLQQLETSKLIHSRCIQDLAIGTVFASFDAMGAKCGVEILREAGHSVLGLSGLVGRSPLAAREAEAATGLRVFSPWELQSGALVPAIRERAAIADAKAPTSQPALASLANAVVPATVALGNLIPTSQRSSDGQRIGLTGTTLARDILDRSAHFVMQAEADILCGTGYRKNAGTRKDWRNGIRLEQWLTDVGQITLRIPRLKLANYCPEFLRRALAPLPAVKAVIEAKDDALPLAVGTLVAELSAANGRNIPLDTLVGEIRSLLDAARLLGLPLQGEIAERRWVYPPANVMGDYEDDTLQEEVPLFLARIADGTERRASRLVERRAYSPSTK